MHEHTSRKIKKIILVHRHGARAPTFNIPNDLSWPNNEQFWNTYGGSITPTGIMQMMNIGANILKNYDFLNEINTNQIRVYSSNTQRTILSVWSLLNSIFPKKSIYIKYLGDDRNEYLNSDIKNHIAVRVELTTKTDKLFHLGKLKKKSEYKNINIELSPLVKYFLQDKSCEILYDKIYAITKLDDFSHEKSSLTKLINIKSIQQQIKIALAHNLNIFPNPNEITLDADDINKINLIGNEIRKCSYISGDNIIRHNSGGNNASYLLSEIFRYMLNDKYNFIVFSGHDTSILALSSLLGIIVPGTDFGCYFLFEIYDDNTLCIYYNPDPTNYTREDLTPKKWDKNIKYQYWDLLDYGIFTVNNFGKQFNLDKMMKILNIFENIKYLEIDSNKQCLSIVRTDDNNALINIIDFFNHIDDKNDGIIHFYEFLILLERLGFAESRKTIIDIFKKIDTDGDGKITIDDIVQLVSNNIIN